MRKRRIGGLLVIALLCGCTTSQKADHEPSACPDGKWLGQHRLVPDARTAEAIYRAVLTAVVPSALKNWPDVIVKDQGTEWQISQTNAAADAKIDSEVAAHNRNPDRTEDKIIVSTGVGFLLRIDKCTGEIVEAVGQR